MPLTRKQEYYLQAMGVDIYRSKDSLPIGPKATSAEYDTVALPERDVTGSLMKLRDHVAGCQRCPLHKGRNQTVFGGGVATADWLIIGEAPGAEEDKRGEPFVGRAGRLLDSMLLSIGLRREQVFIANIIKCRPPNNRDPQPAEVDSCADYLRQQIDLIHPKIILAVGRFAAQYLVNTDAPIGKIRGRKYQYADKDIAIVATYHPAYLLRSPRQKRKVWQDLQLALQIYSDMR